MVAITSVRALTSMLGFGVGVNVSLGVGMRIGGNVGVATV
jgi:hypothetical protein